MHIVELYRTIWQTNLSLSFTLFQDAKNTAPSYVSHWLLFPAAQCLIVIHALNLTDETETMKTETQKKDSAEVKMEDPIFVTLEYYRLEESVLFQFYSPFLF